MRSTVFYSGLKVEKAENGATVTAYNIASDSVKVWVFTDPVELGKHMQEWMTTIHANLGEVVA